MVLPRDRGAPMGMFGGAGGMVKEDGTFEIASVPPGSYYVTALPTQGTMSTIGRTAVDVTREDVENVMLTLASGTTLRGGIRLDSDARQQEQAQGSKIAFGSVHVQLSAMEGMAFNSPGATAKEDGSFEIQNAGPEKYRMLVYNLPPGVWLKSIRAGDQEVLDSGIDLSAGTPGPVEVTLGAGVGQIGGMVQDAKQQPAAGSMVTLLPDPMKEERNDLYRMTSTDQNGRFTLQGIAPGEYKLYAWEDIDPGSYMDPEFLKPHESSARKVTIKANSLEQITLAQIPVEGPATR
jgi:hypothetical protein